MKNSENDVTSANNIVLVSRFTDMSGNEQQITFEDLMNILNGLDTSKFTTEQKERLEERLRGRFGKNYKIVQVIGVQNANHGNVVNISPDLVANILKLIAELLEKGKSTEVLENLLREILKCTRTSQ